MCTIILYIRPRVNTGSTLLGSVGLDVDLSWSSKDALSRRHLVAIDL